MKYKRGVFFSSDALIALIIIFITILIAFPIIKYSYKESPLESDIIKVLSSLKIGEINNSYVDYLISNGYIKDFNKTILEQIGEFYINDISIAKNLCSSIINELDSNDNIGIWYGNTLLCSKNRSSYESAKYVEVDRQLISGISEGESVTGYSSRAYLSSDIQNQYFYFGGYFGEGNISMNIEYSGNLSDIYMEIATNKDFDVYINDIFSGHYTNSSSEYTPAHYDLSAYRSNFINGKNTIKIAANSLYIAGGYIRIIYDNSTYVDQNGRYDFPGIDGIINIYDGFYIPGNLNEMNIFLHLNTSFVTFLNIGNITVYNDSTAGEETINITNSYLSSILDYNELSKKTIPLRFGLVNATYQISTKKDIDVFSVTDLSGSMCGVCSGAGFWCCMFAGGCNNNQPGCESCGGSCNGGIYQSKNATKIFINQLLNSTENRVGLVGYKDSVNLNDFHNLSNNNVSLISKVNSWTALGSTCICCGINKATSELANYSNSSKFRSMVVMSDGEANVRCAQQGTGNAKNDAILAACQAYQNYGIRVFSVGFGSSTDSVTLQSIANCGNGSYYYSNISTIVEIYKEIAKQLYDATYKEQTIVPPKDILTKIYPDSFIKFEYDKPILPYGIINTFERQFFNSTNAILDIPDNSTVTEARVVSYSGPRWTDRVKINNDIIYNLRDYNLEYIKLGDPYSINIPVENIDKTNNITLTTGLKPDNSTEGSISNKIMYKLLRNISSFTPILPRAEGCIWSLEFEDNTTSMFSVPKFYFGTDICNYESGNIGISDDNDAIEVAVLSLLRLLDLDNNGKIDMKLSDENLVISSSEINGIPYSWSTQVQVRRWL
jgi:hypothetical protein